MTELLLIEDDPTLLGLIADALEFEGFHVRRAPDGGAGIDLARQIRPALILCDISMPGMDGYAVLSAVRADPRIAAVPFIFLTARGDRKDLRLGMTSGADDYLTKPVAIDDLLAAVRSRLARQAAVVARAPDFSSHAPLIALGLTPKQAETLFWVAQGKSNAETAVILGITAATVKKHLEHIFAKLGVEKRGAASLLAIEALSC